jgi:hypothetical protein
VLCPLELAIVDEAPVATPEFAREGMGVLQTDLAPVGATDMADHITASDGIVAHQPGDLRVDAGLRIVEGTAALALVKRDTPTILVHPGATAALHQADKAETGIGWHIGAHAKQLAHRVYPLKRDPCNSRSDLQKTRANRPRYCVTQRGSERTPRSPTTHPRRYMLSATLKASERSAASPFSASLKNCFTFRFQIEPPSKYACESPTYFASVKLT